MRNRASQDLFNSFHAVQVSWTCEYFDIHFRSTLRVSFDSALESFTRRCVENEERFQFYIEFAVAIHSRIFIFERSNLYGDQIVLLITN